MRAFIVALILTVILVIFFQSCGISTKTVNRAKEYQTKVSEMEKYFKNKKDSFDKFQKSAEYKKEYHIYAKRENWNLNFGKAQKELIFVKSVMDGKVKQILKRDDSDEESSLIAYLNKVKRGLADVKKHASSVSIRLGEIKTAKQNAPKMIAKAKKQSDYIINRHKKIKDDCTKAKKKHKRVKSRLDSELTTFTNMKEKSEKEYKLASLELKKSMPDYALFSQSCKNIESLEKEMIASSTRFENKIKIIHDSISKTLVDFRIIYKVEIGRSTWDSDSYGENSHTYPAIEVNEKVYEYFEAQTGDIAKWHYWGGLTIYINDNKWKSLRINPTVDKPSWDDEGVFWVNDVPVVYQHKYTHIKNGVKSTGDWENVSEGFFNKHEDNLGQTISSKPAGYFGDEVNTVASPPGLDKVGNPQYGQWKKDKSGNMFWDFFVAYAVWNTVLGGNRFYYNDWVDYDRNYRGRKPYYGKNERYGTYGKYGQTRYSRASAFKRGHATREFTGIKGAGRRGRGRGPGKGK